MIETLQDWKDHIVYLYETVYGHIDINEYIDLFESDIYTSEDTHEEAKQFMLDFLKDHINYNNDLWAYFDTVFEFLKNRQEYDDIMPDGFMDFVAYYDKHTYYFEFTEMYETSEDRIDFDDYIALYQEIRTAIDQNEMTQLEDLYLQAQQSGYFYPIEAVLDILLVEQRGEIDRAKDIADHWFEGSNDLYINHQLASFYARHGYYDQAVTLWKKSIESHSSCIDYARHEIDHGSISIAKQLLLQRLEKYPDDEEIPIILEAINRPIIQRYLKQIDDSEDETFKNDLYMEIGACYWQSNDYQKSHYYLSKVKPTSDQEYDYNQLYSQVLIALDRYDEALMYINTWIAIIEEQSLDHPYRKDHALALLCLVRVLSHQRQYHEVIMRLGHEPFQANDHLQAQLYSRRALAHLSLRHYEAALNDTNRAIAYDPSVYSAHQTRLQVSYFLGNPQYTIYNFKQCIELSPTDPIPYRYALFVFDDARQYDDANEIIQTAIRNQVAFTDEMKLLQARTIRMRANSHEERIQAFELLDQLEEHLNLSTTDLEDISDISFERCLLHWDNNDYPTALIHIEEAEHKNPSRPRYHLAHGDLLRNIHQYEYAIEQYQIAIESFPNDAGINYRIGECYYQMDRYEEALPYMESAAQERPDAWDMNEILSDIYTTRMLSSYDINDLHRALYYAQRDVDRNPNGKTYLNKAYVLMDFMRLEEAADTLKQVSLDDPAALQAHMKLGDCYRMMRKFDEAINTYQLCLGIAKKREENPVYIYQGLVETYLIMKDYDHAIEYASLCKDEHDEHLIALADVELFFRHPTKAISYLEQIEEPSARSYFMLGDAYYMNNESDIAYTIYQKSLTIEQPPRQHFNTLLSYTFRLVSEYEEHNEELIDLLLNCDIPEGVSKFDLARRHITLARVYWSEHHRDKAREHAIKARDYFLGNIPEEIYLNYPNNGTKKRSNIGLCYLYMGEWEKAISIFESMSEHHICYYCRHQYCYERILDIGHAYLDDQHFDAERSYQYYQEADEECPSDLESMGAFRRLKRK